MQAENEVRAILAENLTYYRKAVGLTQTQVSERINYSDKSVSKWERGDGMPDVYALCQLAELYGVSVETLLSATKKMPKKSADRHRLAWTLCGVGLVWLIAVLVNFSFGFMASLRPFGWLAFIVAIPVSGVLFTVFTSLWYHRLWRFASVSLIVWGTALSVDLLLITLFPALAAIHYIYIVAAAVQTLFVIWTLRK